MKLAETFMGGVLSLRRTISTGSPSLGAPGVAHKRAKPIGSG